MTTTEPLDVMDERYDAIVIGTGMGGGAVGHSLVAAGFHVLFVEKGWNAIGTDLGFGDDPERRLAAGWWPDRFSISIDGRDSEAPMPLGCGVGGSTNLYSAALERLEPSDIEPEAGEHTTDRWPVPWSEWMRWYDEAERSLQVRSEDRVYPAASAIDRDFAVGLGRNGLHPYRLHVGLAYRPGCTECGGHKCPLRCKSDASTIFIEPALATGRATLMAECEVLRIDASARRADAVVFRRGDGSVDRASARVVVLAAGACSSPAILLRSTGACWPRGLANTSDMVGRHLMFHANEWIAVWPRRRASSKGPRKTVGFRDFYRHRGLRLGSVQSTGLGATFGNIWGVFRQRLALSRLARVPGVPFALKCAAWMGCRLLGSATIFVMLVEDVGHAGNRVSLDPTDPARVRINYTVPDELRTRARLARRLLRRSFRGMRRMSLQNEVELNFGHACGTCRFGIDPATSVLDVDCRTHDVENLYVVDASFMPSSGGTNPALTIAANALRVGEIIARRLLAEKDEHDRATTVGHRHRG